MIMPSGFYRHLRFVVLLGFIGLFVLGHPYISTGQEDSSLVFYEHNPVLTVSEGAWDSVMIMAGTGAYDATNNLYHLYYSGGSEHIGGPFAIGHATSPDGYTWTKDSANPVITGKMVDAEHPPANLLAHSLIRDGDQWFMFFSTQPEPDNFGGILLWRATAPSAGGPWTVDAAPLALGAGSKGEWDDAGLFSTSVVMEDSGYGLYYDAYGAVGFGIGRASSTDGITWKKYDDDSTTQKPYDESDPILTTDTPLESTHQGVGVPFVFHDSNSWIMFFQGLQGAPDLLDIRYVDSTDGLHWTNGTHNPLWFTKQISASWPSESLFTVMALDKGYLFFFDPVLDDSMTGISVATWMPPAP